MCEPVSRKCPACRNILFASSRETDAEIVRLLDMSIQAKVGCSSCQFLSYFIKSRQPDTVDDRDEILVRNDVHSVEEGGIYHTVRFGGGYGTDWELFTSPGNLELLPTR
jgi:hypothetical protein